MRLQDFRVGWRTLIQHPAYSLVAVMGLGIGLAACLLLLGFVRYSLQYDASVPDADHVYVVEQRYNIDPGTPMFDQAPWLLYETAKKTPGVVASSGYFPWAHFPPLRVGDHLEKVKGLPVLPGFARMLGLQALEGDLDAALEAPENLAITEEAAIRIFGTPHVLGRTAEAHGRTARVAAVLRTPPANTTMPFEVLTGVRSVLLSDGERKVMLDGSGAVWGHLLIRVRPGSSLSAITEAFQQAVDRSTEVNDYPPEMLERLGKRKVMDIKLSPLRKAYFDGEVTKNSITVPGERGDPVVVAGLAAIAFLILLLAAINYVNLATVRILRRQREIAMRKVLGAGAYRIALQFLAESLLVAMLATGLGLLLAWWVLPTFSELMNRRLEGVFSLANIAAAILIGVVLGGFSAIYPIWIAIRVRPNQALAGRPDAESPRGARLRRVMTVLQITTAMSLASVTLAIAWQTDFAINSSPGFDPSPLLIVDLPDRVKESERARNFIAALTAQRSIAGVANSADAVGRFDNPWGLDLKREGSPSIFVDMKSGSANFLELYRIKPVAGRLFDPRIDKEDDPVPLVMDVTAARQFGFASPQAAIGQTLLFTWDGKTAIKRVVGVVPDLRFYSLHQAPRPTVWSLWTLGTTLSVRAAGSLSEAEHDVRALWPTYFPDAILRMQPAKEIFTATYAEDARLVKLLAIATGIALGIAAFGIYVLSAHTIQKRAKEIVLRKLYGARRRDIASLIVREICVLTSVSAAFALPVAALVIHRYLAGYVEHAPVGGWTLLIAASSSLAVALTAVVRHAWIAMNMPPATALRM